MAACGERMAAMHYKERHPKLMLTMTCVTPAKAVEKPLHILHDNIFLNLKFLILNEKLILQQLFSRPPQARCMPRETLLHTLSTTLW